ncbi:hypothetical protein BT63DRAFT_429769 [Microthyrium microscopicum]|uniref:Uncharacterized protein n=1 Tax=Microthyrium microscopicum TaxID=703497 RepID=A0A6A6TYK4_9PEZI|nr:hypothetical protein BT63DRAFT_429769 [Microthyrium microscopicum]
MESQQGTTQPGAPPPWASPPSGTQASQSNGQQGVPWQWQDDPDGPPRPPSDYKPTLSTTSKPAPKKTTSPRVIVNHVVENTTILRRRKLDHVHSPGSKIHKRQAMNPGFLTAIALSDPAGSQNRGFPLQVIMQVATSTTGGRSNVLTPAPWGNGYFSLTDSERGIVQIWKVDGLEALPRDGPQSNFNHIPVSGDPLRGTQENNAYANVRPSIVAEWIAPADAVGDVNHRASSERDRTAQSSSSQQNANSQQKQAGSTYSQEKSTAKSTASGRGGGRDGSSNKGTKDIRDQWEEEDNRESLRQSGSRSGQSRRGSRNSRNWVQDTESRGSLTKRQPESSSSDAKAAIPSGKGCCANSVWIS